MKAFFAGFIFIVLALILAGIGILLYPLLLLLGFVFRLLISLVLVIFAIWLLGKIILLAWDKISG